jgi:hypothetical protein
MSSSSKATLILFTILKYTITELEYNHTFFKGAAVFKTFSQFCMLLEIPKGGSTKTFIVPKAQKPESYEL